jgi:phosphoribosyl 1,2-cyclic phosphate phosphodiesterase
MGAWIDTYADAETWEVIENRFGYATAPLRAQADGFFYKPCLTRHDIAAGADFEAAGSTVRPFAQTHGRTSTLGYRIGNFAYSADVNALPEESFAALEGVEVWMIATLQAEPYPTHAHVDLALEWVARVGPRLAVLTHLSNQLDYDALSAGLPDGVIAAYDGLEIEI